MNKIDSTEEKNELLKKRDVARLLSLSQRTIASMTARGELPHIRFSKRCIRFPRQAILAAMAARTIGIRK